MVKFFRFDPVTLIATVGGSGYLTKMPGTVGSAVACVLYVLFPVRWWIILAVMAAGIWAGDIYARRKGRTDPSEVVIDEVVGMWISIYGLPSSFVVPGFFMFRIVDVIKPVPVCTAEKLPGGWGIMADDVLGGIMTNLIFQGICWIFLGEGWLRALFV